jgi:predicted SnoaL-like aldol condensation-catalyzing enzyme
MPIDSQLSAQNAHRDRWLTTTVYVVQFFFGGWFLAHGLNHWLEFFPRPSGSSPLARELIGALNHSGLFIIVKAIEVVTGVLLLANRFVPLAIIAAFPVALSIAHLNLVANRDLTSHVVGILAIALLGVVAVGYLDNFRSMLVTRAGAPSSKGVREFFLLNRSDSAAGLSGWKHALGIVAGIALPIALTFWTTSTAGPRSAAHYAAVASTPTTPKDIVQAFDKLAFDERKPKDAVLQYFAEDFIDHSARIAGDRQSVIDLLDRLDWSKAGPTRSVTHIAADGDIVAMHYHLIREPGTAGFAAVDFFRVKDGKIVEHWEVMQPVAEGSVNKFGPF